MLVLLKNENPLRQNILRKKTISQKSHLHKDTVSLLIGSRQ